LSVALKRPERSFGGSTDSRASSFTEGSDESATLLAVIDRQLGVCVLIVFGPERRYDYAA
jgi:hypothetical protein